MRVLGGVVVTGSKNAFLVETPDGVLRRCVLKGKVLKDLKGCYNSLAPGDRVLLEPDSFQEDRGSILGMEGRRNLFWRWNEKGKSAQAIAANLDLVVCVASARFPPFRPRFVDRVAVMVELEDLPFLVVLNKADLGADGEIDARMEDYRRIGYGVLACSTLDGRGIDDLRASVAGRSSVFVGQSGVGKSSLLNALEPGLAMRVGEVSEKYQRGRHTTTGSVMVTLGDGLTRVVDTPGFRRLALRGISTGSLAACFPEFKLLAGDCGYGQVCGHRDEPVCRVRGGAGEGLIHPDRYESYLRIRSELECPAEYERKPGKPRRYYTDDDG